MSTVNVKGTKCITSVLKAVEVLEVIAKSEDGLGVTEVSQKLSYGVSATYHLLNTLRQCNMVEQDKRTKKYRIGFTLFRISGQAKSQNLLGSLAMGYLERLQEELQETTSLSMLEGTEIVCVAQAESQRMLRMFARTGVSNPFYFTAGGKLLVACQPRENWDGLISKIRFEKYTDNTILSVGELTAELEKTRERGYGLDNEEREVGIVCLALPIYDCYGEAVAAMSVSGPAHRMHGHIEELAGQVRKVAMELSVSMGYQPGEAEGAQ